MGVSAWMPPEACPTISPGFSLTDMGGYLKHNAMLTPAGLMAMPTAGRSADVFLCRPSYIQLSVWGR